MIRLTHSFLVFQASFEVSTFAQTLHYKLNSPSHFYPKVYIKEPTIGFLSLLTPDLLSKLRALVWPDIVTIINAIRKLKIKEKRNILSSTEFRFEAIVVNR